MLFLVLVGDTAIGRKGTSEYHIRRLFEAVDSDWVHERLVSGLSSGEGLIWHVRDPVYKIKDSATGQELELIDPGVEDKRLIVVEHEFGSVLRVLKREGNTLSPVIRNAWDRGDLNTLVKKDPNKATGAHISIIGHITRHELLAHFSKWKQPAGLEIAFSGVASSARRNCPRGGTLKH